MATARGGIEWQRRKVGKDLAGSRRDLAGKPIFFLPSWILDFAGDLW